MRLFCYGGKMETIGRIHSIESFGTKAQEEKKKP